MKKKTTILGCVLVMSALVNVQAQSRDANAALQKADKRFFIENKGQWHSDVLYLCRMGGLDAWITKYGVNYTFYKIESLKNKENKEKHMFQKFDMDKYDNIIVLGHRVLMKLENTNPNPDHEGKQKQEGYYNYLIGNDPSKYATYVRLYKEAIVKNIYKGIDVRYYFDKGNLRYDFVVHPGADPSQIRFKLEGQYSVNLKDNQLTFITRFGEVQMTELKSYQGVDKKEVKSRFKQIDKDIYGVSVTNYDPSQILIIDPLIYSTYLGGSGYDGVDFYTVGMTVDGVGNAYVAVFTWSSNYDITPGVFQTTIAGSADAAVTKLDPTGANLIYSTYIGGSDFEFPTEVVVDGNNNAYIVGGTKSFNYPTTPGAFQTSAPGGVWDGFVSKLNSTGTGLVYSTYLGGSLGSEACGAMTIDAGGNAYITGWAASSNFPVTPGAYQTTYGGGTYDVFVAKLNPSGNNLIYATFIGGSGDERSYGIAIDGSGNAYVAGMTQSNNYDVTVGAYQTTYGGGLHDAFITKVNFNGTNLIYSTFLGGGGSEFCNDIVIDASGNAYVTGATNSINFPTTPGAFQITNAGIFDAFVTKLNTTGSGLVYSTYLGGNDQDDGFDIVRDGSNNVYISGRTKSTNYPITPSAYQTTNGGTNTYDVLITGLNATGSGLLYSTYVGGSNDDEGYGITMDASGYVYVFGRTSSANYPTTSGAYQTTYGGGQYDAFVTKLCPLGFNLTSAPGTDNQTLCVNTPVTSITYTTMGFTGVTFSGLPTGVIGSWSSNTITISGTPTTTGVYVYTINLTGLCSDEITGTITVNPNNTINLTSAPGTNNQTVCVNTPITNITYSTTGATGATFNGLPTGITGTWSNNTITINGTATTAGTYIYTTTLTGGCGNVTTTGTITVNADNTINLTSAPGTNNQTVCVNIPITNITYSTTGATGATFNGLPTGITGTWSNNTITINGTATTVGTYIYTITLTGGCGNVTTTGTITVNADNTINLTSVPGTNNQTVCVNTPITDITYSTTGATGATFNGLPTGITGTWSNNTITVNGTPTSTGLFNYTINLTGGCGTVSITGIIQVNAPPTPTIAANTPLCSGQNLSLTASPNGMASYNWLGPDGFTSNLQNPVINNASTTASGTYTITMDAGGGCIGTSTLQVNINPSPVLNLSFNNDTCDLGKGSIKTSVSNGTPPYQYQWNTGSTGSQLVGLNEGLYIVTVSDANGCSRSDSVRILNWKDDCKYFVYVPNAFSPNNDGKNDFLHVKGIGISSFYFVIYNRWGNKVFESTDLNVGWDGTYKGELQNTGVYVYVLDVVFLNGEAIRKSGDITLLR